MCDHPPSDLRRSTWGSGRATPLMGDEVFRADVAEWHAAKVGALCERVDALAREIEAHVS